MFKRLWSGLMRNVCIKIFTLLILVGLAAQLGPLPRAATTTPHARFDALEEGVTIVSEPPSSYSRDLPDPIAQLAKTYAGMGLPRILPVVGLDPVRNARDLLHTRGIDLAIVNSDIAAYAENGAQLAGAPRRLRLIGSLYEKTVYVVANRSVTSFDDLNGGEVLVGDDDADSAITAQILIRILAPGAKITVVGLDKALEHVASGTAKALIMLVGPEDQRPVSIPPDQGLHILSIPDLDAVSRIYDRVHIDNGRLPAQLGPGAVETVSVVKILASFDWRPTDWRYGFVVQFLKGFGPALQELRKTDPKGLWAGFDARRVPPGWLHFDPAQALLSGIEASRPAPVPLAIAPSKIEPQGTASAEPTAPAAPATSPAQTAAITHSQTQPAAVTPAQTPIKPTDIIGVKTEGLNAGQASENGVITDILTAIVRRSGFEGSGSSDPQIKWVTRSDEALSEAMSNKSDTLLFPWRLPNCTPPKGSAQIPLPECNSLGFSNPIFRKLQVFFVRSGGDFTFEQDDQVAGHIICVAEGASLEPLTRDGRKWVQDDVITLIRQPNLEKCLAKLDRGEADAVLADQREGQSLVEQLGLAGRVTIAERPVGIDTFVIAVPRTAPDADEIVNRLNHSLSDLEAGGEYSQMINRYLGGPAVQGTADSVHPASPM
jgi:uncharacterized protein